MIKVKGAHTALFQALLRTGGSRTEYEMTALEKGDAVFIGSSERLCFRFLHQGEKIVKKEKRSSSRPSAKPVWSPESGRAGQG